MGRRLIAAVFTTVLVLQAVIVESATHASYFDFSARAPASDCAGHASNTSPCDCCPAGQLMSAGCMSFCVPVAIAATTAMVAVGLARTAAISFTAPPRPSLAYAPPNPPPIH